MRKGWTENTLPTIVEVLDRLRQPISAIEREKRLGEVPYYGANGQAGWIDKSIFDETLVLLGEDAIDFLNPDSSKAYLITGPSWVNNHAHVLRANTAKVLSFFLTEALNRVDYSQYVAFGTRSKLTQGSMNGITLILPPLQEQKRIVDLISSVDTYIDALQHQADSARKSRNSLADEIFSKDFEQRKLSELGKLVTGTTPSTKDKELWSPPEVPFCTPGDFRDALLVSTTSRMVSQKGAQAIRRLSGNSFLQVCIGATIGKSGYVTEEITTNQQINAVEGMSIDDARFLALLMRSSGILENLRDNAAGSTLPIISKGSWGELEIPWPIRDARGMYSMLGMAFEKALESSDSTIAKARILRSGLLSDLLSGDHEIPASYDKITGAA